MGSLDLAALLFQSLHCSYQCQPRCSTVPWRLVTGRRLLQCANDQFYGKYIHVPREF